MSVDQIPPQGAPFVYEDPDGNQRIDSDWYMFLYSLWISTTSILDGGVSFPDAVKIAMVDLDAIGADVANAHGGGGGTSTQKYTRGAAWSGFGAAIDPTLADLVFIEAPVTGTIVSATLLGSILGGTAVVDVWKTTYAASPPTVANSICAAALPTVTAATKSRDTTLTGWTTAVTAGDVFAFKINSSVTFTWLECLLEIQP